MDQTQDPLHSTADDPPPTRVPPTGKRGGVWVTLGDEQYRIPPIAFIVVQEMQDDIQKLAGLERGEPPSPAQMAIVQGLVLAAIKRNYPEITGPQVSDMIDVANYLPVLNAVLGVSGYVRRPAALGETGPSAPTGVASTPA